jgi:type II secretory pathway pseudopilin PulG
VKTLFKRLLRREIGFTPVELAIVMLVVGILSAIAVPAFLGARNAGYDKEAQASVDAAMSACTSSDKSITSIFIYVSVSFHTDLLRQ